MVLNAAGAFCMAFPWTTVHTAQIYTCTLQHIVQVRILQIRQKRCTIRASKARASERKVKRKNTRAPCRIRREGITCRGVVPFAFRRRRDVLFFSFFLKKTRRGSGRLVFLFLQRKAPFPHLHIPAFSPSHSNRYFIFTFSRKYATIQMYKYKNKEKERSLCLLSSNGGS